MSRVFDNNSVLKVISVIIAIMLWLYATSELNPETTKIISEVPIDIIHQDVLEDNQMILVYDPIANIDVKIRGLTSDIRKLKVDKLKAVLDLGIIEKVGKQTVQLKVEGLPRELKLDRVPEISVTVNMIVSKEVPVNIILTGDVANGYFCHQPTVEPGTITINGAETLVKNVTQGVVQMNVKGAKTPIEQSLPIMLMDADRNYIESRYVRKQHDFAIGSVRIFPKKSLPVKANIVGNPAAGYEITSIDVTPENISVNGKEDLLKNKKELLTDIIDIEGRTETLSMTVDIEHDGLFIEPGQADKATVVVRISEKTIEKSLTVDKVSLVNVPEGYDVSYEPKSFNVTLRGRYTRVIGITKEVINLTVDLEGLEAGTHRLPVKVSGLPSDVRTELTQEEIVVVLEELETATQQDQAEPTPVPEPTPNP